MGVEAGLMLTYGNIPISETVDNPFTILEVILLRLFSLRGGPYLDISAPIGNNAVAGLEGALTAMYDGEEGGPSWILLDIPLRVYGRFNLGPLALQPFNGVYVGSSISTVGGISVWTQFEIGSRVYLGPLFIEYSQLIGNPDATDAYAQGYPRFGLGWRLFNDLGSIVENVEIGGGAP